MVSQILVFLRVNVRSLRANFDNPNSFLCDVRSGISIIILSKIWSYSNETSFCSIEGYDHFFCCRNTYRSGGIAVFYRTCLNLSELYINFNSAETVSVSCNFFKNFS